MSTLSDMNEKKRLYADLRELSQKEGPEGIIRTTLSYNQDSMLCHFNLKKGAKIPLHHHTAVQTGYVIKGKVEFTRGSVGKFIAKPGSSYLFEEDEEHGAEVLENSEIIEYFTPMRPEYADNN